MSEKILFSNPMEQKALWKLFKCEGRGFYTPSAVDVYFHQLDRTREVISKHYNGCMKAAYFNGIDILWRRFAVGMGTSIEAWDCDDDEGYWGKIDNIKLKLTVKILRYIPMERYEAIDAANQKREIFFFEKSHGEAYKCTVELCHSRSGECFDIKFGNLPTVSISVDGYEKDYVFLDPEKNLARGYKIS